MRVSSVIHGKEISYEYSLCSCGFNEIMKWMNVVKCCTSVLSQHDHFWITALFFKENILLCENPEM